MLIHQILLKKADIAGLKTDVDNSDVNKLENVPNELSSLKSR